MYPDLNLKDWPFKTVPDPEFAAVWAGRSKTKTQLDRLVRKMQMVPKSGLHILWANFGMGKTHTLYHIKYQCLQSKGQLIPVYAVMPKRSTGFIELYREIVQALPYDFLRNQLQEIGRNSKGNVALHPIFHRSPGVVRALLAMEPGDIESSTAALQWLSAQPGLSSYQLSMINVNYRIKTPEDAINALEALVKLATFDTLARKKLVVMIDEYQRIGELRPKIMSENNSSLHTLFNANPTGLELILSFSFGNQANVEYMLSPELRSRAELQSIRLDTMNHDEAVEFIRDLLEQFRINPDHRWAFPFASDTIDNLVRYISERKLITPRRLMLYADFVLKEFLLDANPRDNGIEYKDILDYLGDPALGGIDVDSAPDT